MRLEFGRRYKVTPFSYIVTAIDVTDSIIEVMYDNGATGLTAAGNCEKATIYDEIRDFDDKEMTFFLSQFRSYHDVYRSVYFTKALMFKNVDDYMKTEIMHKYWNEADSDWVEKALQELFVTNMARKGEDD